MTRAEGRFMSPGRPTPDDLLAAAFKRHGIDVGYRPLALKLCVELAQAQADNDALREALRKLIPPDTGADWWCPVCSAALSGSRVTNDERCETCGTYLPPEQATDSRWDEPRKLVE